MPVCGHQLVRGVNTSAITLDTCRYPHHVLASYLAAAPHPAGLHLIYCPSLSLPPPAPCQYINPFLVNISPPASCIMSILRCKEVFSVLGAISDGCWAKMETTRYQSNSVSRVLLGILCFKLHQATGPSQNGLSTARCNDDIHTIATKYILPWSGVWARPHQSVN